MHSANVVLPEPAWPSKTIFSTCEVSNSGIKSGLGIKDKLVFEFNGESQKTKGSEQRTIDNEQYAIANCVLPGVLRRSFQKRIEFTTQYFQGMVQRLVFVMQ